MPAIIGRKNSLTLKAYQGDNKTLLAFNFDSAAAAKNLAGFTVKCQAPGGAPYYLWNFLRFQNPASHAQDPSEPAQSTVNAPIQKFRWVHVLGQSHQGLTPAIGTYVYTVTPRFFDANHSMLQLDDSLSATVTIPVGPFKKGSLSLGFTRGYMQSEAFVHHFGKNTPILPPGRPLQFNTSATAGTNNGQPVSFEQIYEWMGASARQWVFKLLDEVVNDASLHLDVFAYDLNEPDVVDRFLKLAANGRMRIILDNSKEHHDPSNPKAEDQFETLFRQNAKAPAQIMRGCFARFSHDKIFIISKNNTPVKVLTGSTNFSVTGLYVNANHVLVFDEARVATHYADVFNQSWNALMHFPPSGAGTTSAKAASAFANCTDATQPFGVPSGSVPKMSITFSPHTDADVKTILPGISSRIGQEPNAKHGNVFFAVMQLTGSETPVYAKLKTIYSNPDVYSYGISDSPNGTHLYAPGSKTGVLVTGKPGSTTLPAPFDQVPIPPGHEVHDKFIVCGLNGSDPVVYCGSSNLATGGEKANGDNLLEIHDADVATAFAIEALLLVDHYNFLDRYASPKRGGGKKSAAKSTATKKSVAKKPAAKKTSAKKSASKKARAKKTRARRAPNKTRATKSAAKKSAKRPR